MTAYAETHSLVFTKTSKRALRSQVIEGNFADLFNSINTKSMTVRGWDAHTVLSEDNTGAVSFFVRTDHDEEGLPNLYTAQAEITFVREDGGKPNPNEFESYLRTMSARAASANFGRWTLATVDGNAYVEDEDVSANITSAQIGYTEVNIPENWDDYFSHLYGRDSHVARILGAIEAGITSDFNNRFHCALVGPPGCAKSDICRSLQRALGEEAVVEYDATSTTAAGAIKDLSEREILPRIMVVEEIEKADDKSLAFLLGLMDMRGEIRKTTARTTIQRDTKLLVIATVNNYERFKTIAAGALASRFSNRIGFGRPDRAQLAMILRREVEKINGNHDWIKPVLDYCEDHDISDPRIVISLCLCGRDGLLDGTYFKTLDDTQIDESELQ